MKKALTRFYFRKLKKGQCVRLFYRGSNEGTFIWTHSHVIEDGEPNVGLPSGFRVAGQMTYEDKVDNKPLPVDDYLYECIDGDFPKGAICCGSGAMPLFDDEAVADKWQAKLVTDSEDDMTPQEKAHHDAWEKAFGEAEQKFGNVYSDEAAKWIGQQMQAQGF